MGRELPTEVDIIRRTKPKHPPTNYTKFFIVHWRWPPKSRGHGKYYLEPLVFISSCIPEADGQKVASSPCRAQIAFNNPIQFNLIYRFEQLNISQSQGSASATADLNGISDYTRANWAARSPEAIASRFSSMLYLIVANITENVIQIISMCDNHGLRYLLTNLVNRMTLFGRLVCSSMNGNRQSSSLLVYPLLSFPPLQRHEMCSNMPSATLFLVLHTYYAVSSEGVVS